MVDFGSVDWKTLERFAIDLGCTFVRTKGDLICNPKSGHLRVHFLGYRSFDSGSFFFRLLSACEQEIEVKRKLIFNELVAEVFKKLP